MDRMFPSDTNRIRGTYVYGAFVFSTGHFSNYVMVYEPVEQESSFPMISIVILVMAVSTMLFFRMK